MEVDILAILTEKQSRPIRRRIAWLGHTTQDIKLARTVDGRGLLSKGCSGESIAWGFDKNCLIHQRVILPFDHSWLCVTVLVGTLFNWEMTLRR